ncbi:MAG: ribosome silencing factor [Rickettsiales bacterium]|jgi:ribosome-associated protein
MNETLHEDRTIASQKPGPPSPEQVLELIVQSLDDDKAIDVVVIDLVGKSSFADAMVIASGTSARQVSAMADHVREKLKAAGLKGIAVEGQENSDWVLIDGGDVIVHLFRPEVREFYNIEKLWTEALPESVDLNAAQH